MYNNTAHYTFSVLPIARPNMYIKLTNLLLFSFVGVTCFSQTIDPTNIDTMDNRFFTKAAFSKDFGKEMASALAVYKRMANDGFKEYALATFDFDFTSNTKEKLDSLAAFLTANYGFTLEAPQKEKNLWALQGDAIAQPYSEDNLLFWAMDLYCKGYTFDCRLNGYGALTDPKHLVFER